MSDDTGNSSNKPKAAAHPFAGLLGLQPPSRLPKTTRADVVVAGKRMRDVRDAKGAQLSDQAADVLKAARAAALYQRQRQDPAQTARRQAWAQANAEKLRAYQAAYRKAHADRLRELCREWARRHYHADLDASRAKARAKYAANRERILQKRKAQRDEAKAQKQAAAAAAAHGTPAHGDAAPGTSAAPAAQAPPLPPVVAAPPGAAATHDGPVQTPTPTRAHPWRKFNQGE